MRVPVTGKGSLQVGNPGNRGGGRTPSALRRKALKKGPAMLKVLEDIALSKDSKDSDKVAAAKEHLRIGMGSSMSEIEVRDKLDATVGWIESQLDERQAASIIMGISRIWRGR